MQYRSVEYFITQDENRDTWKWTVNVNESTVESGNGKTREAALAAVVLTVDRWKVRSRGIQANAMGGEDGKILVV